jgi:hypothetical protein
MAIPEDLLQQVLALCSKIDLDDDDVQVDDDTLAEMESQQENLQIWADTLTDKAVPALVELICMPQEEQNALSPNGNGNEICGVAMDALINIGSRHPEPVQAALELLLTREDTVGLALEGVELWEERRMLPAVAGVVERNEDTDIAYLLAGVLYALDGPEAVRLLKILLVKFEDDAELVEQIEEVINAIED